MPQTYFCLLTKVGEAKDANAKALGIPFKITDMAVGDGNGVLPVPDPARTSLVHQVRRAPLNSLKRDPVNQSQLIAEQVIPETEGGWWIRELGLYDQDGDLIAIGNCAESYKPQLAQGSGRTQVVRMVLIMSSAGQVELKVDPSIVLATRQYVDDQDAQHAATLDPHPQYLTTAEGQAAIAAAVSALVNASPATLDTLAELAQAINNDKDFAATMTAALASKAPLNSAVLTGTPTSTTPPLFDASKRLATMEAVQNALGNHKVTYAATGTLAMDATFAGDFVRADGASTYTITLPSGATVAGGSVITIKGNNTAGVSIALNGADTVDSGLIPMTWPLALAKGESIKLVSRTGSAWWLADYKTLTGVTPAKFDKSTKLATMQALKNAGMQHIGPIAVAVSRALTPAEAVGNLVIANGNTGPITLTLPATAACDQGSSIFFLNVSTYDCTLTAAAGDGINPALAGVSSVVLKPGDSFNVSIFGANWECFGGSAQLPFVAGFNSSKTPNGYTQLPNGLFYQWGLFTQTDNGSASVYAFSLPISFPNATLQGFVVPGSAIGAGNVIASVEGSSKNTLNGFTFGPAGSRQYRAWAIGY
jgi:hypothetical protein